MDSTDLQAVEIFYPESDGLPMADNTLQWDWMVMIVGELRDQYRGQEVFVAGNLFWYPVEGQPSIVVAPDALVVQGRPPGYRGSYQQWKEQGLPPQVVFEVLSPNNTQAEMDQKLDFYEQYGVEEYYVIDPYQETLEGYVRRNRKLRPVAQLHNFMSPRLGIRFDLTDGLKIYSTTGRLFQMRDERMAEIEDELDRQRNQAEFAIRELDLERQRAEHEKQRRLEEAQRAEKYLAKLKELGIKPEDLP